MPDDVQLDLDGLRDLNGSIKQILVDFQNLREETGDAVDDIGKPWDDRRLGDAVASFASDWNQHRRILGTELFQIHAFAERIITEFTGLDEAASHELGLSAGEGSRL